MPTQTHTSLLRLSACLLAGALVFSAVLPARASSPYGDTPQGIVARPAGIVMARAALTKAEDNADASSLFTQIGEALKSGDPDEITKWFANNLELDILGDNNVCSKSQARLIFKSFYDKYTPKSYSIIHESGKPPMRYAVLTLMAGGEKFRLTVFVHSQRQTNEIQQIRIEKE